MMDFGLSTHIFFSDRLTPEHLDRMRSAGFAAMEIFCSCQHFDHHDQEQVEAIFGWFRTNQSCLNSLHSPFYVRVESGERAYFSLASADEEERRRGIAENAAALRLRELVPFRYLVVHLGTTGQRHRRDSVKQAKRSLCELIDLAGAHGVTIAVENIPNTLSTSDQLARLADEFDEVRFCLDTGHAHIEGNVIGAVQRLGERIVTTHIHDNFGREDEHLPPYEGGIPWTELMNAFARIPYSGVYMFEVRGGVYPDRNLKATVAARERFERSLTGVALTPADRSDPHCHRSGRDG
jgi:sugar phosphate isomerase/epimerase